MSRRDDETALSRMGATCSKYMLVDDTKAITNTTCSVVRPATGIEVTATVGRATKTLQIDPDLWEWLKPLFVELHTRRRP